MENKKRFFSKLLAINKELWLFTTNIDEVSKEKKLIMMKLDTSTLLPTGMPVELLTMKKKGIFNNAKFHVEQSEDSKFTLFIAELDLPAKEERKFQLIMVDDAYKVRLNKLVEIPKTRKKIQLC